MFQKEITGDILTMTFSDQGKEIFELIDLSCEQNKECSKLDLVCQENTSTTIVFLHSILKEKSSLTTKVTVQKNAALKVIDLILPGGDSAKAGFFHSFDQEIILAGKNSRAKASTIFIANQEQTININSIIKHQSDNSSGELFCRGVLFNAANADFTATLVVPPGIKNIETHQNMKCLTQGEKARCCALPILDIHSDSVIASHGVAIARVEDELSYYIEYRGIEKEKNKILLLIGFLNESLFNLKLVSQSNFQQVQSMIKKQLGVKSDE